MITVSYNSKDYLLNQVASVKAGAVGLEYEQIISDNGSTDNALSEIKSLYPEVKIIENKMNLGFGSANNKGAQISSGDFLLFLNPDMKVLPETLKKIVVWMKMRPEVGIVGPKLTDEFGLVNLEAKPRRFPTVLSQLAIIFKLQHLFPAILNDYLYQDFNFDLEQEVDSVRGSFLLMRREVYKTLGWAFDPRYFIWFEDVDICRETKKIGFKVIYTPIISGVDYVGQSFKKVESLWKQKRFTDSMLLYFKKWGKWYEWLLLAFFRPFGLGLVILKNWWIKLKK